MKESGLFYYDYRYIGEFEEKSDIKIYNLMESGENLEWCAPLLDKKNNCAAVRNEGKIISVKIGYKIFNRIDKEIKKTLAEIVAPNYNDLKKEGYTDEEIINDTMTECGCEECPFRNDCDAMLIDD